MKQNDIKMLLFLMGVLSCIVSHFVVRDPLVIEMETLASKIETQTVERDRLKVALAELPRLYEEIEQFQIIVENEMLKYPEDILLEGYIMYALGFREDMEVELNGLAFSTPAQVSKMDIMRRIKEEDVLQPVATYRTTMSFSMDFTYDKLKSYIEYIAADPDRTVVESISIAYNAATGHLTGSTVINKYFIATPNYTYVIPDIPLMEYGNANPFGTIG